ncbi:MAG: ABC transporter ATP-binding protein [Spirochaetia bacterium]|nr:ABC transporter ATP-binding protein [Spirochaetia bacterium]MCF7940390.1 ABC transporter ATP-binding protein [Spirochaetia bacterium]
MKQDIVIRNLKKSFPEFLLDVDFTIRHREMITIVGPSGCGKSTTLSLITGLIEPDQGSIAIGDEIISDLPVWERNIGFVFQDYALFPHMRAAQNIGYGLKIRNRPASEISEAVTGLLETIQLQGYESRSIEHLSGGERQRIALARAVAPNPRLLLLDEPLSALDAKLRVQLRKEIQRIHHDLGLTTLYVTHDQEEALAISDRIIVMNQGRIEQIGTPEEVYHRPASLFVAQFIGESNILPRSAVPLRPDAAENDRIARYVSFRPEKTTIRRAPHVPLSNEILFDDVQLLYQEFAGQYYACTFTHQGVQLHAYSKERLDGKDTYMLTVEQEDLQTIV